MSLNRYLSYGAIAAVAWMAGGIFGYAVAPNQRANTKIEPVTVSSSTSIPALSRPAPKPEVPVIAPVTRKTSTENYSLPTNSVASRETFRLNVPRGVPVVLVREVQDGSEWCVQDRSEPAERSFFTCTADFGSSATPPGTPFEMTTLVAMSPDEIQQFAPGTTLRELPSHKLTTPVIQVVRR